MAAMSAAHSLSTLALSFGLLCGAGVALVGLPANFVILSERFPTRIATAMGVAATGMGVGVLALIPAIQLAADRLGWREAFVWSGIAATIVILAICASYRPVHATTATAGGAHAAAPAANERNSMRRRMLDIVRSGKWQGFAIANFLMGSALFGVLTHQVALLRESGWTAMAAATSLGLVNLFRSASGPLWGVLLDRSGRRLGYGASTAIAVVGLAAIASSYSIPSSAQMLAYFFIVAFGVGSAGTLPTNASLGNELFSREQRALAWGFVETAYAGGAAFGSWIVGWLFDRSGDYVAALALTGVEFIASYALVVALSSPRRGRPATAHG
jgi:MFS family permease